MLPWIFLGSAAALSIERLCYIWIWRNPDAFQEVCGRDPVAAVRWLFYAFKIIQAAVFLAWCYVMGNGSLWPPAADPAIVVLGAALIATGQWLNASVFYRLGGEGVFYGNRFGHEIAWCRDFPFSCVDDPQYFGAVLSIWGFFLLMRFPHDDWYLLPALETIYYAAGARFER